MRTRKFEKNWNTLVPGRKKSIMVKIQSLQQNVRKWSQKLIIKKKEKSQILGLNGAFYVSTTWSYHEKQRLILVRSIKLPKTISEIIIISSETKTKKQTNNNKRVGIKKTIHKTTKWIKKFNFATISNSGTTCEVWSDKTMLVCNLHK